MYFAEGCSQLPFFFLCLELLIDPSPSRGTVVVNRTPGETIVVSCSFKGLDKSNIQHVQMFKNGQQVLYKEPDHRGYCVLSLCNHYVISSSNARIQFQALIIVYITIFLPFLLKLRNNRF